MAIVDAPLLPPFLFNKNGRYTYVCTYKNKWDPKLQRAVRVKGQNVTVGKIADGGLTGFIEWKDEFKEQYPELNKLRAVRKVDEKLSTGGRVKYCIKFSRACADNIEEKSLVSCSLSAQTLLHTEAWDLIDNIQQFILRR